MMANYHDYFRWTDPQEADILVKFRCRGIDPWVVHDGQVSRLSVIDSELSCELESLRKQAAEGWPIKLCGENIRRLFWALMMNYFVIFLFCFCGTAVGLKADWKSELQTIEAELKDLKNEQTRYMSTARPPR